MRLIDADARIEEVKRNPMDSKLKECVLDVLRRAPTIAASENKALTLDQLRQMDGEPVWLAINGTGRYVLITGHNDTRINVFTSSGSPWAMHIDDYGKTWLAYARRPEPTT